MRFNECTGAWKYRTGPDVGQVARGDAASLGILVDFFSSYGVFKKISTRHVLIYSHFKYLFTKLKGSSNCF